jgi:hypothetical protein
MRRQARPGEPGCHRNGPTVRAPTTANSESASATVSPVATADIERWQPVAESMVRDGVTSKHPRLVATILAHREAGVPPSSIGRHHRVHHTTVGRILSAAEALKTSVPTGRGRHSYPRGRYDRDRPGSSRRQLMPQHSRRESAAAIAPSPVLHAGRPLFSGPGDPLSARPSK